MSCKKCKIFIREKDTEYFIVHLWEGHGFRIDNLRGEFPDANWEYVDELVKAHKATGRKGIEKFR